MELEKILKKPNENLQNTKPSENAPASAQPEVKSLQTRLQEANAVRIDRIVLPPRKK
jgi:hypothetical protein